MDRSFDPALTWAGSLAIGLGSLDRAGLEAAWTSVDAVTHRAILKVELPDVLRQLVAHVQERLAKLPPRDIAA